MTKHYLENFEGKSGASSVTVTPSGVRLPDQPCKFVMISNWNVENAPNMELKADPATVVEATYEEIYYGFNGVYSAQLIASRSTELLPVNNCNQICIRSRPDADEVVVWYTWFF